MPSLRRPRLLRPRLRDARPGHAHPPHPRARGACWDLQSSSLRGKTAAQATPARPPSSAHCLLGFVVFLPSFAGRPGLPGGGWQNPGGTTVCARLWRRRRGSALPPGGSEAANRAGPRGLPKQEEEGPGGSSGVSSPCDPLPELLVLPKIAGGVFVGLHADGTRVQDLHVQDLPRANWELRMQDLWAFIGIACFLCLLSLFWGVASTLWPVSLLD